MNSATARPATRAGATRTARAADHPSIEDIVRRRLPSFGARPAIRYDDGRGYRTLTFVDYVANLRRALELFGPTAGEPEVVCTFVKNRPEWDMVALAALYSGRILFPLDTKLNDVELRHILTQARPDRVLVSAASRGRMKGILRQLGIPAQLVVADLYPVFEDVDAPPLGTPEEGEVRLSDVPFPTDGRFPEPAARLQDPDAVIALYATSGTTSLPRVVRITHGNVAAQLVEGMDVMNLRPTEDLLNIGPYSHIATLLEFLVTKARGFTVTYFTREPDEDGVLEDEIRKLKRAGVRIKALMAVPKFWIFLMKEVLEEMKDKAVWRSLYRHLSSIERQAGLHDIGTLDKAKLTAVRIFLRNKMGGHFSYGISSSTRIDPGVVDIFAKLGVTVIDIYGATEASGIIARNRLNERRRGSCGRLIEALDYTLESPRTIPGVPHPVGELWVRGDTVSAGYVESARPLLDDEGFYHTGDLAWVDEERWVYLVGRRKELIEWDDGSLVDPMHLSNLLVRSIWVKDALVARLEGDDFLSVFVLPDEKRLAEDEAVQAELAAGVRREQVLRDRLEDAVDYAQSVSGTSAPLSKERLYLLPRKLERTPTHKIKFVRELERLDLGTYV
jgi:long-chain acyl-CoA synthetase